MERKAFRLGEWLAQPNDCTLRSADCTRRVEPQLMDLLVFLASRAGQVVTRQDILDGVWGGTAVSEDSITTSIYQLRRALGDDAHSPRFIETIPKRGYRLLVAASAHDEGTTSEPAVRAIHRKRRYAFIAVGCLIPVALAAIGFWIDGARRTPGVRSLAVLPLKNLSAEPGDDYLSDGITAALITELAKMEPLRVISRTSVTLYRDSPKSVGEIARELQVDAILEGSLLRSGERVRIDARLIDATRDTPLWAESYERDIGDLLQLQQLIAQSIAHGIQVRLASERPAAAREPVPEAAMEAYLKGRSLLDQRNPATLMQVRLYFERARQIAPAFAEAAAGQADAYALMGYYGIGDPVEVYPLSRTAAMAALDLDPDLAEAHTALATILFFHDWDLAGAEKEIRRAIQLQPNLAIAHRRYAYILAISGRRAESIAEARIALALDPVYLPSYWDLAEILMMAREYDEVIRLMKKALELDSTAAEAYSNMQVAYAFQGKTKESYAAFRAAAQSEGMTHEVLEQLEEVFAKQGLQGIYRVVARRLEGAERNRSTSNALCIIYAAIGERDRAFELLEEAYRRRDPGLLALRVSPYMDPLRSDPRFSSLVRRLEPTSPPAGP
ncbi:MAG: winged helix-turn-helix domain-containing protein [Acidobacteriota bacterium]